MRAGRVEGWNEVSVDVCLGKCLNGLIDFAINEWLDGLNEPTDWHS